MFEPNETAAMLKPMEYKGEGIDPARPTIWLYICFADGTLFNVLFNVYNNIYSECMYTVFVHQTNISWYSIW